MYSHLILLTIVKGEDDLHSEAALLQTAVFLLAGGVILNGNRYFFVVTSVGLHSGTISCFIQNGNAAVKLIAQIPLATGNGKNRFGKLCFHSVCHIFSCKAILAVCKLGDLYNLISLLDCQALKHIALSRCSGQGDRIAHLVAFLIGSDPAIKHICDMQFHSGRNCTGLQCKGEFYLLTSVAIVADDRFGYCGIDRHTCNFVGIAYNAINRNGQRVRSGAFYLEVCTVTADRSNRSSIKGLLCPIIAALRLGNAEALPVICTVFTDNTEGIGLAVTQLEAQHYGKAFATIAILTGQIVLGLYGNGSVLICNFQQPGIILVRIIGIQYAMSLVGGIPSVCILRSCIQAGFKAAGNVINLFFCFKAIGIGLPIQQHGFTVDVKLLAVAGIGSDHQGDGIANQILIVRRGNRTTGQLRNIELYIGCIRGGLKYEGDLDLLALVAIVTEDDRSYLGSFCCALDFISIVHNAIDGNGQCVCGSTIQLEVCALTADRCDGSRIKLLLGPIAAVDTEALAIILAVLSDNAENIFLAVAELEAQIDGVAFNTVAIIATHKVLGLYGNRSIFTLDLHQPCIILVRIIGIENAVSLVGSVPSVCILRCCIQAGLEAAGNAVYCFGSHKAIGIGLPIQQQRFTVDVKLLAVAGIGNDSQGDRITQLIAGLIRSDLTIGQRSDVDTHKLAGVHQLIGDLHRLLQVAVHSDLDPNSGLTYTAGIAGGNDL